MHGLKCRGNNIEIQKCHETKCRKKCRKRKFITFRKGFIPYSCQSHFVSRTERSILKQHKRTRIVYLRNPLVHYL